MRCALGAASLISEATSYQRRRVDKAKHAPRFPSRRMVGTALRAFAHPTAVTPHPSEYVETLRQPSPNGRGRTYWRWRIKS